MQWVANQLTGWTVNVLAGFTGMIGAFIVACLAALAGVASWHRRRIKAGARGVEPVHLILLSLIMVFLASGVGLAGFVWQMKRGGLTQLFDQQASNIAQGAANDPSAVITSGPTSSEGKTKVGSILGKTPPRAVLDQGKGNQFDVGIVSDGTVPIPAEAPLPWPGTEYSSLSDDKLRKLALEVASQMRPLALDWSGKKTPHDELQKKFINDFRGKGAALAEEILARQKIFPPYTFQAKIMYPMALQGHFAGPNPIADAAVFLEDRARMNLNGNN